MNSLSPARLLLGRTSLLDISYADARAELAQLGGDLLDDDSGVVAPNLGVGLYAPAAMEDPQERVEAVIAFVEASLRRGLIA